MKKMLIYIGIAATVLFFIVIQSSFRVQEGNLALITKLGKLTGRVEKKGFHFKIPMLENVRFIENGVFLWESKRNTIVTADKIFIATGARSQIPDIEGLAGTPFMSSREALRNTQLPNTMIIIGGGYIACELGHAYGAFGTKVRFLVRSRMVKSFSL